MLKFLLILTIILSPFATKNNTKKDWLKEVNVLREMVNAQSFKCEQYAKKMARTERFFHDPNLKSNQGENIAYSSDPSTNPIVVWKNSAGHYRNMVDSDFKKVGLGIASYGQETYFVMRLR